MTTTQKPQPGNLIRITAGAKAGHVGIVVPTPDPSFWEGNIWVELGEGEPRAYLRDEIEAAALGVSA